MSRDQPGEAAVAADTGPSALAALAPDHPELWDEIEAHPNCYDELREWIAHARAQIPHEVALDPEPVALKAAGARKGLILGIIVAVIATFVVIGIAVVNKVNDTVDDFEEALGTPLVETPEPSPAAPTYDAPTETTAPPFPSYEFSHSQSWSYADDDGYSFEAAFAFGAPVSGKSLQGSTHPNKSAFALGSACTFDPSTDAVIVGRLSVTSTTRSFPVPVLVAFSAAELIRDTDYDFSSAPEVAFESSYTDGPECDDSDDYDNPDAKWPDPLEPGDSATHAFFIILRNYFTPATPGGDTAWLRLVGLEPIRTTYDTGSVEHAFSPDVDAVVGVTFAGVAVHPDAY